MLYLISQRKAELRSKRDIESVWNFRLKYFFSGYRFYCMLITSHSFVFFVVSTVPCNKVHCITPERLNIRRRDIASLAPIAADLFPGKELHIFPTY